MSPCYLKKTGRGSFEGKTQEAWKIAGKINIPAGSTFVLWQLGNNEQGPKLIELAAPGNDIAKRAILLLKVFHAKENRYYGKRRVNLSGPLEVTVQADFNVYQNEDDFGLTVR